MSTIGLRCDASPAMGVGHLVRCLALAEELLSRGVRVVLLGDVGTVTWVAAEVARLGLPVTPAPATPSDLVTLARRLGLDAVVIDSYVTDPACAGALRAAGIVVLAVVDGDPRGQEADLYLDQNLDAELAAPPLPPGSVRLAGLRYVLLRDSVRRRRGTPSGAAERPRVVCFFGGTDPRGAAPVLAGLLAATGVPLTATVLAATPAIEGAVRAVRPAPGQEIEAVPNTPDLPGLLAGADLALSAAGTSTWELLCLGVCPALIRVADNQRLGYDAMLARGLAVGLGGIDDLDPSAVGLLKGLLTDPGRRRDLAVRGRGSVDGDGRVRAVDALLGRMAGGRRSVGGGGPTLG